MVVGLAPAAHGANRTGRVFTGDRSGDVLFAALHRAGLANQPTSVAADDGLRLTGCRVAAAVRCAPPANPPTPRGARPLPALPAPRAGPAARAPTCCWRSARWAGTPRCGRSTPPRPWPRFGHGAHADVGGRRLVGSYHPSQQNTFTGRLTPAMLDDVLALAATLTRRSADGSRGLTVPPAPRGPRGSPSGRRPRR